MITLKLTILSTSDTHGYILPTTYAENSKNEPYSLAKVSTAIKALKDENTLVIDAGDWLQGSKLTDFIHSKLKQPTPIARAYNTVGYTLGILGNHEFTFGLKYLREAIGLLNYPILCANVLQNGYPAFGQGYTILNRGGFNIAVLGLVTSLIPYSEKAENIEGLEFKDAVQTARELIPKLRKEADVVIVAYHGGYERDLKTGAPTENLTGENVAYELIQVPGIDALLTAHQHDKIATVFNGVPTTQNGHRGEYIGKITLELVRDTKEKVRVQSRHAELIPTKNYSLDPKTMQSVQPFHDELLSLN